MAQEQEEEDARRIREEKQREREKIKKKYYNDTTWEECDENWSPKLRRSQKKKTKSRFY